MASLTPDKEDVSHCLKRYNELFAKLQREGQAKPDMVAVKQMTERGEVPARRHGHIPGVKPGDEFVGRGELAALSLHSQILRGIDILSKEEKGAYAIVLSGGYADDEDEGTSFWYTGEGGQGKGGVQVADQEYKGGNLGLKHNHETQTPVRVFRAKLGEKKERRYVYDGLYMVAEHKRVLSKNGRFMVCQFRMVGVPGESVASVKVEHRVFHTVKHLKAQRLASAVPVSTKRARIAEADARAIAANREVMLREIRRQHGASVLMEDISCGAEDVPIPLINTLDTRGLPEGFQYTRDYTWGPGVREMVTPVLTFLDEEMAAFTRRAENGQCGIRFNRHLQEMDNAMLRLPDQYDAHLEDSYNGEGCLMVTDPCGVHECGPECSGVKCRRNRQLTRGVQLPLEVFMTQGKGFGVRCRQEIPAGTFVCQYVGQLLTDAMAETQADHDNYLFDLDFFVHIWMEIAQKGLEGIENEIPVHKIPPVPNVRQVHHICQRAQDAAAATAAAAAIAATAAPNGDAGVECGSLSPSPPGSTSGQEVPAVLRSPLGLRHTPSKGGRPKLNLFGEHADEEEGAPEDAPVKYSPLLVIDAEHIGGVARFINHSCDPNLAIQAVFAKEHRNTFLYCVGLFAQTRIMPGQELTYNYG